MTNPVEQAHDSEEGVIEIQYPGLEELERVSRSRVSDKIGKSQPQGRGDRGVLDMPSAEAS